MTNLELAYLLSAVKSIDKLHDEISELLSRALKLRNIPHNVLNAKLHQREAEIVAEAKKVAV